MGFIQFTDHLIPYNVFLDDVAARVVKMLKSDNHDPEFISQRKAWKLFGRSNVERWKAEGKIEPIKRPGRYEFNTAELRYLQRTSQDYLKGKPS